MSDTKFTPGPWHYQELSDAYTHIVRDSEEKIVASTPQWRNGIAEANARLIAAGPELYEALKDVEWAANGACPQCGSHSRQSGLHAPKCILGNALAKAVQP